MKIRRKFNLDRIGKRYESIDIESSEHDTVEECVQEIEDAWRYYCKMITEGKVE